ncbi:hypothetical protein EXIGLDRAFT_832279, partial [Exidia glandulosa HHB12029]
MAFLLVFALAAVFSRTALAATRTLAVVDVAWKVSGSLSVQSSGIDGKNCEPTVQSAFIMEVGASVEYTFAPNVTRLQLFVSTLSYGADGLIALQSGINGANYRQSHYVETLYDGLSCVADDNLVFDNLKPSLSYTLMVAVPNPNGADTTDAGGGPHKFAFSAIRVDEEPDEPSPSPRTSTPPTSTSAAPLANNTNTAPKPHTSHVKIGLIALGAALGGLVVVALLGLYIWRIRRKLRQANLNLMMHHYEPADFGGITSPGLFSDTTPSNSAPTSPGFDSWTASKTRNSVFRPQSDMSFMASASHASARRPSNIEVVSGPIAEHQEPFENAAPPEYSTLADPSGLWSARTLRHDVSPLPKSE